MPTEPRIALTLTEQELRNLTLGLVQREIEPLITRVLGAVQDVQSKHVLLLDALQSLETRLQRLEMREWLDDGELH